MASLSFDNRGSFGSKRSRNDDSSHEGDWNCPECGNMNFGFRTACNRTKCGAPRPTALLPTHDPMTSHYSNPTSFYVGGYEAPPLHYGVSNGYGSHIPPSGVHYNYGAPLGAHGAYGHIPTFSPAVHYGDPSMGYASPRPMNGYGYGFHGCSGGMLPDNLAPRKRRAGRDGSHDGDWSCPNCDNVNFAFRTVCNIKKCGAPRPSQPQAPNESTTSGAPEGSWTCGDCGNLNYPFRTVCNRKECGSEKP